MVHLTQSSKNTSPNLAPLDNVGWLSEQSDELRDWFLENGRWRDFEAGETLFLQSDEADGMYGLGTGAMDLEFSPEGLDSFLLIRMQPGAWAGQASLIPQTNRQFSLRAPSRSEVFFVPRRSLNSLLSERPQFWPAFYALALKQIVALLEFLCEVRSLTPDARLARLILRLSAASEEILVSQYELEGMLGMSRSSLRRSIRSLTEYGAINTGYGKIVVVDQTKLKKIALPAGD